MALFSESFDQLQAEFLSLAEQVGAEITSLPLPYLGPKNEKLNIHIAALGPEKAEHAVVHMIGVHGVEGFLGSAIQREILRSERFSLGELSHRIYFVHPVNPYGMAWLRRVNGHNVDLNRNFVDDELPDYADYQVWSPFLNPQSSLQIYSRLPFGVYAYFRLGHDRSLQAIAQGQYRDEDGLFYGGAEIQPELDILGQFIREHLNGYEKLWIMDVHSGLGEYGKESLMVDLADDPSFFPMYEKIYGTEVVVPRDHDGYYKSYGDFSKFIRGQLDGPQLHYVLQEFGTYNPFLIGWKMRKENVAHRQGVSPDHHHKKGLLEGFFPRDGQWRQSCLETGVLRFQKLVASLKKRAPHHRGP